MVAIVLVSIGYFIMSTKIFLLVLLLNPFYVLASLDDIGVGTHLNNYKNSSQYYSGLIKDYGFTSVRDGFSWNSVQTNPQKMNLTNKILNADVFFSNKNNESNNINSLFVLGYGSDFYTNGGYPQDREQVDKFVDYVGWVANRYKGKVKYYEIWNEWFLGTGIGRGKPRPRDDLFLYLIQQSYKKIKEIDPNAIVIAGSINPLHKNEVNWLNGLIKQGLMNYIDGISIHPYAFNEPKKVRDPEGSFTAIDQFEASLSTLTGKTIPLYITEMGYPTGSDFTGGVTTIQAAQNVVKYTLLAASRSYIKGLWWYDLIDDGTDPNNKEHNFGLLYQNEKSKEAADLLKALLPIIKKKEITVTTSDNENYVVSVKGIGQITWIRDHNYSYQLWLMKINKLNN